MIMYVNALEGGRTHWHASYCNLASLRLLEEEELGDSISLDDADAFLSGLSECSPQ